ncbi:flavodoxin family protein [Streptomyces sp. AJS327]|uniref:NAD(P)H-dependent oxidoreductase n=1 Tax=Streptomyces sp. AJS327 TaxID=2545265 RepID=UPI0015DF0CCC|nr:flavodoxin family protein [Streptomyces sp. AJS327]
MKVLWITAHPDPRSLTSALRDEGVRALGEFGHRVRQSDLYAMGWKAVLDAEDFPAAHDGEVHGGGAPGDDPAGGGAPGWNSPDPAPDPAPRPSPKWPRAPRR